MTQPITSHPEMPQPGLGRRKRTVLFAAGALVLLAVAVFAVRARKAPEPAAKIEEKTAQPQSAAGNLREVMQARVHDDYTFLSFTIWHDAPLTSQKMDSIAAASGRIVDTAKHLDSFESSSREQGWSSQDVQFFSEKRVQLSHTAEELRNAAQQHDASRVVHIFSHLDSTCQSCHKRFRPDLAWTI
jgi:cytochrome c556